MTCKLSWIRLTLITLQQFEKLMGTMDKGCSLMRPTNNSPLEVRTFRDINKRQNHCIVLFRLFNSESWEDKFTQNSQNNVFVSA